MARPQVVEDAAVMLRWLVADIEERGGTGRRPWKLLYLTPVANEARAKAALRHLIDTEQVWLDRVAEEAFGFIYVTPGRPPEEHPP